MTTTAYDDLVRRLRAGGCVFAEDEARLLLEAAGSDPDALGRLVGRRLAGEPLEHLVGWADFAGLRVLLTPGVFIPRQRTAYLVGLAAAAAPDQGLVVDLCCGSGAIGAALLHRRPGLTVHATDDDPVAVDCARRNLGPLGGRVHLGDLAAPLPPDLRGRVDVLVANVPYVPTGAVAMMPEESREHEPRATVDGGGDGLDVVRRLAGLAPTWLRPGGTVLVETGTDQAAGAVDAFAAAGLAPRVHHDPERHATAVSAVATVATEEDVP